VPDIRADLSQPAVQASDAHRWVASPQPGVARVMLDRVGDEVAVATSLVRYDAGSVFPDHVHALGEEYIVLEGEFGDEHGRYPVGAYVRNPPGSHHAPFSEPGCLIFVKLRQFDRDDQRQCVIALDTPLPAEGWQARELHRYQGELVREIVAAAGTEVSLRAAPYVQELLVIEGSVVWGNSVLNANGWVRVPTGADLTVVTRAPSRLFSKTRPIYS